MGSKIFWVALVQIILVVSLAIAQTDLWKTMKGGQLMAADEATLKMAQNIAFEGDYEAIGELIYRGRLAISEGGEGRAVKERVGFPFGFDSTWSRRSH
jgi:hypothetical protein